MRVDQEAAVKAYRIAKTEDSRVLVAGGATEPSRALSDVASGKYLQFVIGGWRFAKEEGLRTTQPGTILYSAAQGWSPSEIHIKACEDASRVKVVDKKNRDRTPPGNRRYVQDYTVTKVNNAWKVSRLASIRVASFDTEGCS